MHHRYKSYSCFNMAPAEVSASDVYHPSYTRHPPGATPDTTLALSPDYETSSSLIGGVHSLLESAEEDGAAIEVLKVQTAQRTTSGLVYACVY